MIFDSPEPMGSDYDSQDSERYKDLSSPMKAVCHSTEPIKSVYDTVRLPLRNTMYIRVIRIRSSITSDFSDTINCDFSILDVENGTIYLGEEPSEPSNHGVGPQSPRPQEKVVYQALSYTWGDSSTKHTIKLNGTLFDVRRNLWDFLQKARRRGLTGYLWVDAICIDQRTVKERNHQVGIMGDIYRRAECVIVWLGNWNSVAQECVHLNDFLDALGKYEDAREMTLAARGFMYLPYWRRAWIVQEYHFAQRKDFWYGELRLTQQDLEQVKERLGGGELSRSPANALWHVQNLLHPVDTKQREMRFATFFRLLEIFAHLYCADRRDQIFALLPLLTSEERADIALYPDYTKSRTELFKDVATHLSNKFREDELDPELLRDFYTLEHVLAPSYHDLAVQSAILDLRALPRLLDTDDIRSRIDNNIGENDHLCRSKSGRGGSVGVRGCGVCHTRPFLTLMAQTSNPFSKKEWQKYAQALLASEVEAERQLGMKYCRDRGLDLGMDENSDKIVTPESPSGEKAECKTGESTNKRRRTESTQEEYANKRRKTTGHWGLNCDTAQIEGPVNEGVASEASA